jgi:hypothetical protein
VAQSQGGQAVNQEELKKFKRSMEKLNDNSKPLSAEEVEHLKRSFEQEQKDLNVFHAMIRKEAKP